MTPGLFFKYYIYKIRNCLLFLINNFMFRSQDISPAIMDFSVTDISLTVNGKETETSFNKLQSEKKVTCNCIITLSLQIVRKLFKTFIAAMCKFDLIQIE